MNGLGGELRTKVLAADGESRDQRLRTSMDMEDGKSAADQQSHCIAYKTNMMMPSRGLVSAAGALRSGARLNHRFIPTRTYLTALNPRPTPTLRSGRVVAASAVSIAAQARLASTSAAASTVPPPPSPATAVPPTSPTDALATDANAFDINDIDFAGMPERLGYLKDIGLDYGWGPTAMVEWALEHIHIYSGFSWWGSIAITAFLFRTSLVPLFVKSADMGAKMRAMLPLTKPLQARMMEAMKAGDQLTATRARQELSAINKSAGIRNSTIFLPAMLQGVFGFCAFRLLRAMSALPVPGLETGGFLWITDLTQADPYFLLPAVMAGSMHLVFRMGGEAGTPMTDTMKPIMLYILPGVVFITTSWLPAALDIWLTVTGFMGIMQVSIFRIPAVRSMLGMTPLISQEQATRDAIAYGVAEAPGQDKTINVQARSRPAAQKPVYQAPNIKYSTSSSSSSSKAAPTPSPVETDRTQPSLNPLEKAKQSASGWAEKAQRSWKDVLSMAQARGGANTKQSKTRSAEYMRRAEEYERRWKNQK